MCGIIAISSNLQITVDMKSMLELIAHRGPDDMGAFISYDCDCQLGHVRLSIIDLSEAGHQPMTDSSSRYVISFNGEIYNYLDLKNELEKVHGVISWKSTTDTEVILEGYAREGFLFFEKLNGIFAFSIYDKKEKILIVVRDPLGIKPLYYTEQKGTVYFSSELKSLLKIFGLKKTIRLQSMADQLTFMFVPEPHTIFEEFFKFDPGYCKIYSFGKCIKEMKLFSKLEEPLPISSKNEMIDLFYHTFSKAVKRQLMADVPISLLLSGGLDSSAVTAEAISNGANIKDAFTISFNKRDTYHDLQGDDLYYAKIISKRFGIRLNVIQAEMDLMHLLPKIVYHLEDGVADPAAINTYLICKGARDLGIKVLLSGQGADEYLGGYRRYVAESLYESFPFFIHKSLSLISRLFPASIPGVFNANFRRMKRFCDLASDSVTDRMLALSSWSDPSVIKLIFKEKEGLEPGRIYSDLYKTQQNIHPIESMMRVDQKLDLVSLNLLYTDKMSMMTGVEARVPFLDFDLVRIMNSLPLIMKINKYEKKYILKQAMKPFLPKEIIFRSKAGFSSPIRAWFRSPNVFTEKYFDDTRIKKQGIFDSRIIEKLLKNQYLRKTDNSYTIYALLNLQIWLEVFCSD